MIEPVTKEGIRVEVGQIWRDLDKRMGGRTVKVVAIRSGNLRCEVKGAATTKLSIGRMHRPLWELVK